MSALAWMLPLRSQASEYFVGASHFREEADKTWFMASPCHNLAHLPDAILTVPWREHGIASPLPSAGRGYFEPQKARSLPELGEPSLFCPKVRRGHGFLQFGQNHLFCVMHKLWMPCPVLAMTSAEDAAMH